MILAFKPFHVCLFHPVICWPAADWKKQTHILLASHFTHSQKKSLSCYIDYSMTSRIVCPCPCIGPYSLYIWRSYLRSFKLVGKFHFDCTRGSNRPKKIETKHHFSPMSLIGIWWGGGEKRRILGHFRIRVIYFESFMSGMRNAIAF